MAKAKRAGRSWRLYAALMLVLVVFGLLLRSSDWRGSTQLHTIQETAATLLALVVGAVALLRHYSHKTSMFLYIGAGFLGTGLLDGYHAAVTSQWFGEVWPSPPPSLIPWSWNASRTFLGGLMLLSWLAWRRERAGYRAPMSEGAVFLAAGLLTAGCVALFAFAPLPRAYYPELPIGRPQELGAALLLAIGLAGHLSRGAWRHDPFESWLVVSLIIGLVCQATVMALSFELFDAMFDFAHLLKSSSYLCVLIGLLASTSELYRQAAELNRELEARVAERTGELERSNRDLTEFASVASHDLKAPLRAVDALSGFLEEDLGPAMDDESRKSMRLLRGRVRRMQRLLDDLLRYAKAGREDHAIERVDSGQLIRDAIALLEPPAGFRIEVAPAMPTLEAERAPLEQVLRNLIDNAIKHHDRAAGLVTISARAAGDAFEFSVADDGPGVPPQYRDKVFELFQTLKSRDEVEGSGLGLSLIRRLIERQGGRVWIEPTEGRGFDLRFTWPASRAHTIRRNQK